MVEDQILLPNDAFGQHYASAKRFDDEVDQAELMDEAKKYYANILWPLSSLVTKKIEEVQKMKLPIRTIAPSHGIIWRKDPGKIINSYVSWAGNKTVRKAVIVYETMWNSTGMMARYIAEGVSDAGCQARIFNIAEADRTEAIGEMLDAKGFILGSSTHDNDMLPTMAGFMEFLKGSRPKNRIAAAFGSYGWSGGAAASIEKVIKETGIEIGMGPISSKFVPDESERKKCYEFGRDFAALLK
jgi:flavorubredoxin